MFRMNGTPRAQGSAGAARFSFAQRPFICQAAKVMWSLISGHAVNPSMGARARRPVSHGPETRDHTPSAMGNAYSGGGSVRNSVSIL